MALHPEPTYKDSVQNQPQATERSRRVRNQQPLQKNEAIGVLQGDEPWENCDQKATSLLYICIGTEGRRILKIKQPRLLIVKEPVKHFWKAMKGSFNQWHNITYYRTVFLPNNREVNLLKVSFYGRLIERVENCSLGDEETTLRRDTFFFNKLEYNKQDKLLRETGAPAKALETAIQMKLVEKTYT